MLSGKNPAVEKGSHVQHLEFNTYLEVLFQHIAKYLCTIAIGWQAKTKEEIIFSAEHNNSNIK